ncbi:MAG: hypothetical protein AAF587_18165 [Bacteroidota bacterium]
MKKKSYVSLALCIAICTCITHLKAQTDRTPTDKTQYSESRQLLLSQDQAGSLGADVRLSKEEQLLNQRLRQIQREKLNDYQANHFFPPARYFYASRDHMEQDELFRIFRRMPKGGVHHMHSIALGDVDWVIAEALKQENCYVYWGPTTPQHPKGAMRFFRAGTAPAGYVKAQTLNKGIPNFQEQMREFLTLDMQTDADSTDIWKEFEHYFGCVYNFVHYQAIYKAYYEQAYRDLLEDGIQHIEVRMSMLPLYSLDKPDGYYPVDSTMVYQQQILESLQGEYPNFTLKLIYTNLRFLPAPVIQDDLIQAYELRQRFPDLVEGYDLVAEEDAGRPTIEFLDIFLTIDSLNQAYGRDMPLFLHDGESNWVSNNNLIDAVLLGSKRIGHAFNLFRYPVLWDRIKSEGICLEICPLSNQILGYIRDLRNHPASLYLKLGLPISISSDDPAPFDYTGVTPDYWAIFYAWELDLKHLKQLCKNALIYSALNDAAKQQALENWEKEWKAFVMWANAELAGK